MPTADYESELGVVIGKDCKDVTEEQAMEYVLGYTATNDISSRKTQFETSQWCRSKSYDKACPMGESRPIFSRRESSKLTVPGFVTCYRPLYRFDSRNPGRFEVALARTQERESDARIAINVSFHLSLSIQMNPQFLNRDLIPYDSSTAISSSRFQRSCRSSPKGQHSKLEP